MFVAPSYETICEASGDLCFFFFSSFDTYRYHVTTRIEVPAEGLIIRVLSAFEFADDILERLFKHVGFVFLIPDLHFDGVNFVLSINAYVYTANGDRSYTLYMCEP